MKVFQIIYGEIPEPIEKCLKSVYDIYKDVIVYRYEKVEDPVKESDNNRVKVLMENDDCLYIDWDVILYDKITLNKDKVCCNYYCGYPDYSIIYSPKKEFWVDLNKERIERRIDKNTYGWVRKLLRDKNIFELNENFNHLRYSKR